MSTEFNCRPRHHYNLKMRTRGMGKCCSEDFCGQAGERWNRQANVSRITLPRTILS